MQLLGHVFGIVNNRCKTAPVIIGWGPYGKHLMPAVWFPGSDVRPEWISKYAIFESPDPLYWTRHGYAVINVDPRGLWMSEGTMRGIMNSAEAEDVHDLIEWAGQQEWSNGKVGMTGVSYFAIIEWFAAATRPSHLAAISPWEGFSDRYREGVYHGGILETGLNGRWWTRYAKASLSETEDGWAMMHKYHVWSDYWADGVADLEKIEVPAYIVASWTDQGLHTRGTLEGFKRIASKHKWLEVHGRKKWEYQYQPENVERLRLFFDRFLKGMDNEVSQWPKVRLEVRERAYVGEFRAEEEWPIARTKYQRLYLDAGANQLSESSVATESEVRYNSEVQESRAAFDYQFDHDTELIGHMRLHLWVEADAAEDMDLFIAVDKIDRDGNRVNFPWFGMHMDGHVALGWLRVSHRELDETRSTEYQPWLKHERQLKLKPGEIVPVDIEIWPSGTLFRRGEKLRLSIQGSDPYRYPPETIVIAHAETINTGEHIVRTGGRYDSYLVVPVIPSKQLATS